MLHDGVMRGRRLGHFWIIDQSELRRLAHRSLGGRPWSASSAWAVLAQVDDNLFPDLSPHERSRARHRLAQRGLAALAGSLRSRSLDRWFFGHPSILARIQDESGVVLAGASAAAEHNADILAVGSLEAYIPRSRLQELIDKYQLDADSDQPNVHLRVVENEIWPFHQAMRVAPRSVVGIDLFDSPDERSQRAGAELFG